MVQIIAANPKPRKRTFGEQLSEGLQKALPMAQQYYNEYKDEQKRTAAAENESKSLMENYGINVSGLSPEMRKSVVSEHLKGQNRMELENARNLAKSQQPSANDIKNKEKLAGYTGALNSINKMKEIGKKGNLGIGTSFWQAIDPNARKDAGEYETLGKSLISFISDIPIRNKAEFEVMAHSLYDPSTSDSKRQGILDGLQFRIEEAMRGYEDEEEFPLSKKKKLNKENLQNLPPELAENQLQQLQQQEQQPQQAQQQQEEIPSSITPQEIQEKSYLEKAGRVAGQFGLGALESATFPYEMAVTASGAGSTTNQAVNIKRNLAEDYEDLLVKKYYGESTPEDEEYLEYIKEMYKNPERIEKEIAGKPIDVSVRGGIEKLTGLNLNPEGIAEKAAHWTGFIKDPRKITSLLKSGTNLKDISKAIAPTGTEVLRGLGAGTALQAAENNEFGPIGTMAAMVLGDLSGAGIAKTGKGAFKLITEPKKTLAEVASKFTSKDKIDLQKDIIKDFRESGIQADLGTITDSNLIKMTQSRLAQSGLTGKELSKFKDKLTGQIKEEYSTLANSLGEAKIASAHEGGQIAKDMMKSIRDKDLSSTRSLYESALTSLKENAVVDSRKVANAIEELEKNLKPGSIKSAEQQSVLNSLEKIKKDLYAENGNLKMAKVKELINDKIALNDIINYEVQGGAKQLLKGVVGELDRAIISHGKENVPFVRNYISANKKFSNHAKTFRTKSAKNMMNAEDPSKIINKMNTVQGVKELEKILSKDPNGKEIFNNLKRYKMDKMIGDNLVDSTTQQVKLGTFSKLLQKGQNKELAKEILGPKNFKRLEMLQKNSGKLADAAEQFYNASKSASTAADIVVMSKGLTDLAHLLSGNPWPLMKTSAMVGTTRRLSKLIADPTFLQLVEEVILASEKSNPELLVKSVENLRPYILYAMKKEEGEED
jgi:hypothetical protein